MVEDVSVGLMQICVELWVELQGEVPGVGLL